MQQSFSRFKTYLLATLMAMFFGASSANAAYTELQLNEVFTVTFCGTEVWTYTATADGFVKIVGAYDNEYFGPCLAVYSDGGFSQEVDNFYYAPAHYEFVVEKGHTYYIKNNNMSQDIHAMLVLGEAFAFTGSSPEEGAGFYVSGDTEIRLFFTSPNVTFTTGEMTCNGHVIHIYNFDDYNQLVQDGIITYTQEGLNGLANYNGNILGHADNSGITIPFISATGKGFRNIIMELLESGQIAKDMDMVLTMHGVKHSITGEMINGNGEMTLRWVVGGMPTMLQTSQLPPTIKSWHNPGDRSAIAEFTFSRELKSAVAFLEMGKADDNTDDLYTEQLNVQIDGNILRLDFSGVQRTYETMGLENKWTSFTILLANVTDINGNLTYTGDQGSAASYTFYTSFTPTTEGPGDNPNEPDQATLLETTAKINEVNTAIDAAAGAVNDGRKHVDIDGLKAVLQSLRSSAASLQPTGNKAEAVTLLIVCADLIRAAENLQTLAAESIVTNGDISGDNRITVLDYNKLLRRVLTNNTAYRQDDRECVAADVNEDRRIDTADITSLINILLGKISD